VEAGYETRPITCEALYGKSAVMGGSKSRYETRSIACRAFLQGVALWGDRLWNITPLQAASEVLPHKRGAPKSRLCIVRTSQRKSASHNSASYSYALQSTGIWISLGNSS